MRLARIGLGAAVKIGFFLGAAAGFLLGLFWGTLFALFSSLLAMAVHARHPGMGPGALVIMPVFSAVFCGFVGAMISFLGALVYNLTAGAFGGLEIEADFRDEMEKAAKPAVPPVPPEQSAAGIIYERLSIRRRPSFRGPSERPRMLGLRRARRRTA